MHLLHHVSSALLLPLAAVAVAKSAHFGLAAAGDSNSCAVVLCLPIRSETGGTDGLAGRGWKVCIARVSGMSGRHDVNILPALPWCVSLPQHYWAKKMGLQPEDICLVSVAPQTAPSSTVYKTTPALQARRVGTAAWLPP